MPYLNQKIIENKITIRKISIKLFPILTWTLKKNWFQNCYHESRFVILTIFEPSSSQTKTRILFLHAPGEPQIENAF